LIAKIIRVVKSHIDNALSYTGAAATVVVSFYLAAERLEICQAHAKIYFSIVLTWL
jgi:phage-related holin